MQRCLWCQDDPVMEKYHDEEWGMPVFGDAQLFERMVLESFQAGLSWRTILHKRDGFRRAFAQFDLDRVAAMDDEDVRRLLDDAGIVRHQGKIQATIDNARVCQTLRNQWGSLWNFFQSMDWTDRQGILVAFRRLFRFMGPTVTESFLEAVGLIEPLHSPGCWKQVDQTGYPTDFKKKIWIVGAGSVGSAFAALLSGRWPAFLVGDSPHAVAVKATGLLASVYGKTEKRIPVMVKHTWEMNHIDPDDIILLTGKIRSLESTAYRLRPLLHPGQAVVALQNGLGFEPDLDRWLGQPASRGIVQFGANSDGAGRVIYYGGKLILPPSDTAGFIQACLHDTAVDVVISDDFTSAQWQKLLINCVANPLAGLLGISNRDLAGPLLNDVKMEILREVKDVAKAEGAVIPMDLAALNGYFRSENIPSLVRDLDRGLATEIDFINGHVAARGWVHGIATPVNQSLTAMIHCLENMTKKGS